MREHFRCANCLKSGWNEPITSPKFDHAVKLCSPECLSWFEDWVAFSFGDWELRVCYHIYILDATDIMVMDEAFAETWVAERKKMDREAAEFIRKLRDRIHREQPPEGVIQIGTELRRIPRPVERQRKPRHIGTHGQFHPGMLGRIH